MGKIAAQEFNIRGILHKQGYSIEDYQREYRWEEKHITDLLEDLTEKFLNGEEHYFLGSIIINEENQKQFIIDGQQRLTSLTLLLIYIYRTLRDQEDLKKEIDELIYSKEKGFNLDVDTRNECMEALRCRGDFDSEGKPESIKNIVGRYRNIKNDFLGHLAGEPSTPSDELELVAKALPKFADWLIEKVYLVRITAHSGTDAYAVFETMNDRGVSLAPAEMLKGYLLTKSPEHRRKELNDTWKELINELKSIGNGEDADGNGEDADAIKAWLRSQYAQDTRKREKNAPPRDFERIGTEFHRWVSDKVEEKEEDKKIKELQLIEEAHFGNFISEDFSFYGKRYKFIRDAAIKFDYAKDNKVEAIHYNAYNNFTLQRTVLLAPLRKEDAKDDILRKLRIVSSYLDIMIARRFWNDKPTAYNTMQYTMFSLIRRIRGESIDGLKEILIDEYLDKMGETFDSQEAFGLRRNTPRVRYLLARMTDYIETSSDPNCPSHYHEYIRYEVEHIWADQYKDHGHEDSNEFENEQDFSAYRNRIGGLLLLPGPTNRRYGKLPYTKKRGHYIKENLLAQSLHEGAYQRTPFKDFNDEFKKNSGLEFQPHTEFKRDDLNKRQALYRELCKQIWNPEKLREM